MDGADTSIVKLRGALAGRPLRLAVLFGSQATRRASPHSDVDIGILPVDAMSLAEELGLASTLSGVVGREVDLVRLDEAAPLVGREVAQTGIPLVEAEAGLFVAWRDGDGDVGRLPRDVGAAPRAIPATRREETRMTNIALLTRKLATLDDQVALRDGCASSPRRSPPDDSFTAASRPSRRRCPDRA